MKRRRTLQMSMAAASVAGLGIPSARAATPLGWLTWESLAYDEYVGEFVAGADIDLQKGFIGSDDEQFAKLRAGGGAEWDLITPGLDKVELYVASDLLQPLDLGRIANASHL